MTEVSLYVAVKDRHIYTSLCQQWTGQHCPGMPWLI